METNNSSGVDLLSIGDATIDIFLKIHDLNERCRLDKEKNELRVRYGEKILIDDSQFMLGGNACNVAVGASRLSISTSFITELGDDEFSEQIIKGLKKEKIDTSKVLQTPDTQANFAIVITFQGDRTIFVRHILREHKFSLEGISPKWIYLTSIGKEWKKAYANVAQYVEKNKVKLAFNPGTPQMEEGLASFMDIIRVSEILFVNKTEAMKILNIKNEILNIKGLLVQLKKLGPKIVVITDGVNGSYLIDESSKMYKMGIYKCDVVQKTGAGDAYTSGFLSAFILGYSLKETMRWGTINSAAVIQKIGAQRGLLTRNEIEIKLKENVNFQPTEI